MVGWHHRLNVHEFEQTRGESEGPGSLVRSRPRDHRVGHDLVTEQQSRNELPERYVCGSNGVLE